MDRERGHLPGEVISCSQLPRLKVLTLGDQSAGKSCLVKRYCEGKFIEEYIPTIGIDYGVKTVSVPDPQNPAGTIDAKVNFWDTAGPRHFYETRSEFYNDSHGVLVVFSVSDRESFNALSRWLEEFQSITGDTGEAVLYIIGTKNDQSRQVTFEEARQFALKRGCKYLDTSAAVGTGVKECFDGIFKDILAKFSGSL